MRFLSKTLIATTCCALLLTSIAFAADPGDYGPEAETDFETKRDAFSSGFEWGVEYSSDPNNRDNAYNQGYEDGYKEGYNYGAEDNYDETHDSIYQEGYEEGYRAGLSDDPSAPDNDIIDRSEVAGTSSYPQQTEKKSWINSDNVDLLVFPLVGVIALFLWILDKLIQKRR